MSDRIRAADTTSPRLEVELRVLGVLSLLWIVAVLHGGFWALATLGLPGSVADLPWGPLVTTQVIAMGVVAVSLVGDFPATRWARPPTTTKRPNPWPLVLAAVPLSFVMPIFIWRDRRERDRPSPTPEAAELAFARLLQLPRALGLKFLTWASLAAIVDAIVLGVHAQWPREAIVAVALLWITTIGPLTAVMIGWTRGIVRPEYLTAPRGPSTFVRTQDVRLRLIVNATIASIGVIATPLCVGYLWLTAHHAPDEVEQARQVATELADLARNGSEAELGRLLADHPSATVRAGERTLGRRRAERIAPAGPYDTDADGTTDVVIVRKGNVAAVVQTSSPAGGEPQQTPLIVGGLLALVCAVGTTVFIANDVHRDVTRGAAQADAVAKGAAPDPMTEGTFATYEIRQLVVSVDRLVKRITEANVAKYVAIEKAKEADRLKSQFLANMSHDLRSPLNSILGFSELLLAEIDGKLTSEQNAMVHSIHENGRTLLRQIDDILDTAKIEAARLDLHPEPTPPATLLHRAIANAKKRRGGKIGFKIDTAPGLPPAFVDPYRTVQALENVLLFASERMEEGTIDVSVRLGKSERGRMIFVQITTPIAPATTEQLARARRGFFRIPGHRGLGLGLPIAGSILELEGGALGIEDVSEGMVFTAQLCAPEARRTPRLRPVKESA